MTLITVVGILPYIALQLKGISGAYALMTTPAGQPLARSAHWFSDSTLYIALALAGFTIVFGARHLDSAERHEGMVAAIAFESIVKLLAFLAVGVFVVWGLFDGLGDLFARAMAVPELDKLLSLSQGKAFAYEQWFALTLLSMLSVIFLPRQFQVMVVENVDERHLRRAAWVFPLYLLLINLFVLPIALGGLLHFGPGAPMPKASCCRCRWPTGTRRWRCWPLSAGCRRPPAWSSSRPSPCRRWCATTWSCRCCCARAASARWAMRPRRRPDALPARHPPRRHRRHPAAGLSVLPPGRRGLCAGQHRAHQLCRGGAVRAGHARRHVLEGRHAPRRAGRAVVRLRAVGLHADAALAGQVGLAGGRLSDATAPSGIELLKPEQLFGLRGLDNLTHSLFWSLLANVGAYVGVSLWRAPSANETSQALLFVDVFQRTATAGPVFWRGRARVADLLPLLGRFLGTRRATELFEDYARRQGAARIEHLQPDAQLVQFVETQLAGAIGSASARVMVASVVQEESLGLDDVMRILDEASQLRAYSHALEDKSRSLERATAELRSANEQLKSLDRLKDDFMSSVTHELRTPLTSIRALAEVMVDDAEMPAEQRQHFLGIVVAETERLSRLVNQVLDMAKIESGHAEWHNSDIDLRALLAQAVQTTEPMFRERGASVDLQLPDAVPLLRADADRLMQVMLNLLSNAAKFVPREGGRVQVRLQSDTTGLTVAVMDNGAGVPADQRALIFEKFRQGGDHLNRPQGTGLGLPISRQIVEHFGGRMWLQADAAQGACFCFTLPWPAAAQPDETQQGDTT